MMKNPEVWWYHRQHVLFQAEDKCVVGTWIFARSPFSLVRYHLFNTHPTCLYTFQLGWTTSDREDTRHTPGWRQNNVLCCDWYFPSFCNLTWIFWDAHSFTTVRWNHLACNTSQGWYIIHQLITTIISLLMTLFRQLCFSTMSSTTASRPSVLLLGNELSSKSMFKARLVNPTASLNTNPWTTF